LDRETVALIDHDAQSPAALSTAEQDEFLTDCGPLPVNLGELTRLGPVEVAR
jgi:hypothetical protein